MKSWGELRLSNLSNRQIPDSGLCLLCVAKNELYFLPFFLEHYRKLGVKHFIFIDDSSDDGGIEFLLNETDVTLLKSNFSFNDQIDGLRFGVAIRGKLSKQLFSGKWSLIADADEFWSPPNGFENFSELIEFLDQQKHNICKGIMYDCFPERLVDIDAATTQEHPEKLNPFTDSLGKIIWTRESQPRRLSYENNVRNRLLNSLQEEGLVTADFCRQRGIPNLYKVPLVKWKQSINMISAHRLNGSYTETPRMNCAHYKFFPTWQQKIKSAMQTKAYYNNSIEYKFLALAYAHLRNRRLISKTTVPTAQLSTIEHFLS
jgi:hypothetical protein